MGVRFRVQGAGFRFWGSGFRVQGSGSRPAAGHKEDEPMKAANDAPYENHYDPRGNPYVAVSNLHTALKNQVQRNNVGPRNTGRRHH